MCERSELLGTEVTKISPRHSELWLGRHAVTSPRLRLENYSSTYDHVFRMVLVGESEVGKTALTRRIAYQIFHRDPPVTVGRDCRERVVKFKKKTIKVELWDTAGTESTRNIFPSYFHSANAVLIMYDLTNKRSFRKLSQWFGLAQKFSEENTPIFVIGTKNDLDKCRVISDKEIKAFVDSTSLQAFEVSALTGFGVEEAFMNIVRTLEKIEKKKRKEKVKFKRREDPGSIVVSTEEFRRSCWCSNSCRNFRIAHESTTDPSVISEESRSNIPLLSSASTITTSVVGDDDVRGDRN